MSTYPNMFAAGLRESLKIVAGAALALALLSACSSDKPELKDSQDNADAANAAVDEAANALEAAGIDMNVDENLLAEPVAAPEPTCTSVPANGALLVDHRERKRVGHVLEIDNGTEGDAIIKVRNADTDRTLASFFVTRGSKANLRRIPDGSYRIQYMIGDKLGEDCRKFIGSASANEFPGPQTLTTEDLGDRIRVATLSYTLYAVPGGNTTPVYLNPADFEKP
jgi:hypothetical protein